MGPELNSAVAADEGTKGSKGPKATIPVASGVITQPTISPKASKRKPIERHGSTSGSPGQAVSYANRWRENYNPLRQLTIATAVQLLERAQRGDTALCQWTFRFIERRHPTLSALISRCEAPLLNFDWEIKLKEELPPGATEDMAKRQQATLKDAYDGINNLKEAIRHLHLAEFRGYSHLQKHRTGDGDVYHFEPLDQWCVCRDGLYGDWFWNPDSRSMTLPSMVVGDANRIGGAELPLEDFIITEVDRPIDEIALINAIRSGLCEKDWDAFIEIYGIPGGVVVMPGNVPQGKEPEYEAAAQKVAEGGSGAIPNGADYKANDGPRGVDPFTPRLKHLDEHLIMAGTGGKLTMLAESGSGTLAGNAHADTFEEIADGRGERISEVFQRDFDAEVLDRNHPGEPVLAYFRLVSRDRDSAESVSFKRDIVKSLAAHEMLSRVLANQTDLKETVRDTGLEVNEDYTDPYVPVVETNGAVVTGDLVKDSEGDVIGAETEPGEPEPNGLTTDSEDGSKDGTKPDSKGGNLKNRRRRVLNGDVPGHEFHGNQWREATAGAEQASKDATSRAGHARAEKAHYKAAHARLDAAGEALKNDDFEGFKFHSEAAKIHLQFAEHHKGMVKFDKGVAGVEKSYDRGNIDLAERERRIGDLHKALGGLKNREVNGPELPKLEEAGLEVFAKALAEDMQAMREKVAALGQISDDTILKQRALDLVDQVERLKADIGHLPKSAQVLAEARIAALFTGLTGDHAEARRRGGDAQ